MRHVRPYYLAGAAACALIAAMPQGALARTGHEAALEARVAQLEKIVAQMQGQMGAGAAQNQQLSDQNRQLMEQNQAITAQLAEAKAANADTGKRVASLEARPVPPAEGFKVGNTTVKLGGYIKATASFSRYSDGELAANSLGRDFYLPQTIPIGPGAGSTNHDFSAKQTRLWLNLNSDIAGHTVKGYLETDFQTTASAAPTVTNGGSQRTTNGYTLALRRAYVQVDKFLIGQEWTNFQNQATLPESTDFVGVTEGTVFVRQPQVRYTTPLGKGTTLALSAENAETGSAAQTGPTLTENDDDRLPDFTARLNHSSPLGDLSLAVLGRELTVRNRDTLGALTTSDHIFGWGVSGAGKLYLKADKSADLRFMVTYGQGIGRYVGLNFAPDVIVATGTGKLSRIDTIAAFAALHLPIVPGVRTNLMASWQHADYPDGFAANTFNLYNQSAWSVAGNLFWSPVKNIDVGVEYRHGRRELVNGASGQLDRVEMAAKYSF